MVWEKERVYTLSPLLVLTLYISESKTAYAISFSHSHTIIDARHEKTDLKVFVLVIPKEGWARMAPPT